MEPINFDELAKKAYFSGKEPERPDLDLLWKAVFELKEWHFIAMGDDENIYPYIDSLKEKPMIFAFTDTQRLYRLAQERKLTDTDGNISILSIPTDEAAEFLAQFVSQGIYGIWFNPSDFGFYAPLKNLSKIQEHILEI